MGLAYDVSGTGAWVLVDGHKIDEFADDQSPVEVEPIEIQGTGVNINNNMTHWSKPSLVTIKINIIAGSADDLWLFRKFKKSKIKPIEGGQTQDTFDVIVHNGQGSVPDEEYTNCVMQGGPAGSTISTEGRIASHTYTFVGEDIS